jgi:hypothetical protein
MIIAATTSEVKKESRYAYRLTAAYTYPEIAALTMSAPPKTRAIGSVLGLTSVI